MTECSPIHKFPLFVKSISIGTGINAGSVFTWYQIDNLQYCTELLVRLVLMDDDLRG